MPNVFDTIGRHRIVPVLARVERREDILPLCDALRDGGLPVLEITLRTQEALAAISLARNERPDMLIGAGTVLTGEQVTQATQAGAHFLVSPGLDPALVRLSQDAGVPIVPGVITPSEVQAAMRLGLQAVKFFPSEAMGGVETLKFMHGPYPSIKFLPTGGITLETLDAYLRLPNVLACGGSWILNRKHLAAGDYVAISHATAETMARVAQTTPMKD